MVLIEEGADKQIADCGGNKSRVLFYSPYVVTLLGDFFF